MVPLTPHPHPESPETYEEKLIPTPIRPQSLTLETSSLSQYARAKGFYKVIWENKGRIHTEFTSDMPIHKIKAPKLSPAGLPWPGTREPVNTQL